MVNLKIGHYKLLLKIEYILRTIGHMHGASVKALSFPLQQYSKHGAIMIIAFHRFSLEQKIAQHTRRENDLAYALSVW